MGGAHASNDCFPPPTAPGFPSEPDEFRRTYFGNCRAGASVLLDTSKERRNDREANVLESIEVTGTNNCKHPWPYPIIGQQSLPPCFEQNRTSSNPRQRRMSLLPGSPDFFSLALMLSLMSSAIKPVHHSLGRARPCLRLLVPDPVFGLGISYRHKSTRFCPFDCFPSTRKSTLATAFAFFVEICNDQTLDVDHWPRHYSRTPKRMVCVFHEILFSPFSPSPIERQLVTATGA